MSRLLKLKKRKIAVLGLGIENFALLKFILGRRIKCSMVICDARSRKQLGKRYRELSGRGGNALIKWRLGDNYDRDLAEFDIIFRSPGYPLFTPAMQKVAYANTAVDRLKETEISSPIKLFFELCPSRNIIGITGTKGKGTTASLIFQILKTAGKRVFLGGNIGTAPFDFINRLKKNDWVVLELSSFQLEDLTVSPRIAVITNFFRDHLAPADPFNPNYHRTMEDYWRAKLNIVAWQDRRGTAIINKSLENKKIEFGFGKKIYFSGSNLSSRLPGGHNKENIGAALAVANVLKIKKRLTVRVVKEFKGLEHRLELAAESGGVKYYNDSFATTPEAAITAIGAFSAPIILIAGGANKGAEFNELAAVIKRRVKLVVLLAGDVSFKIRRALLRSKYPPGKIESAESIEAAVLTAKASALPGDIILLSPACASFGMFKNYKDRGMAFKREVKKI